MDVKEYYTAPPDKVFQEIKIAAITVWTGYDNTHGYVTEKLDQIVGLENVKDNAWFMVQMFDRSNIKKLLTLVSPETAAMIKDALRE